MAALNVTIRPFLVDTKKLAQDYITKVYGPEAFLDGVPTGGGGPGTGVTGFEVYQWDYDSEEWILQEV